MSTTSDMANGLRRLADTVESKNPEHAKDLRKDADELESKE